MIGMWATLRLPDRPSWGHVPVITAHARHDRHAWMRTDMGMGRASMQLQLSLR